MLTGQIFIQLIIILIVVQVFGYLCQFIGQPRVIGEILAGLALGPTLLGVLLPKVEATVFTTSALPTLQTLGDIGLVLYMFSLGTHIDTHAMLKHGRKATVVSLSGVLLPLAMGGLFAFFLYPEFAGPKANLASFMLLVGTAMAITAFPVLARLLEERGMLTSKIGALALLCAAIDDVVGWCLLALVIAIIHTTGAASIVITLVFLVLFVVIMLLVVRPLLVFADQHIKSKPALMTFTVILLLLAATTTNAMGIHPVFGAFMMGVILPRRTAFVEQVKSIDQVNYLLFLPLYFVHNGLRTHIGLINSPTLWIICTLVLIVACISKILGGSLSLKVFGSSWKESLTLGTLMNTRGLVELIVLNIGLDLGIITPTFFAMLVIMAIVTTMMAPPLLSFLGYSQAAPFNLELNALNRSVKRVGLPLVRANSNDSTRRQRHALIPLNPSNWRRLFVRNGRVLSALPELDIDHPLQRPDHEASLLAVLKSMPVMQQRVSAQLNIDQELSEGDKTLLRTMLNIEQELPEGEQTLHHSKLSIGHVEPESVTIYAFLDIQQDEKVVERIAIKEKQVVVGRIDPKRGIAPGIDLTQFDTSSTVSRQHARICVENSYFSIEDLESRNKTRLGELALTPRKPEMLQNGDVITFGSVKAAFRLLGTSALPEAFSQS